MHPLALTHAPHACSPPQGQAETRRAGPRSRGPAHTKPRHMRHRPPPTQRPQTAATRPQGQAGPAGSQVPGDPERTGAWSPSPQCHWTHSATQHAAGTYPHLGGSAGRGPGGRAAASGRARARARAGASAAPAPRSERASVRPSVPPHRGCGARRLRLLICPRPLGGAAPANRERPCADGRPAAPPLVLQLSSPHPHLVSISAKWRRHREGGALREGGIPETPAAVGLQTP